MAVEIREFKGILPPPEISAIVIKTAAHLGKRDHGALEAFESKIRQRAATDPRFSFSKPDDAYYPFYQHQLLLVRSGEVIGETTGPVDAVPAAAVAIPDDGRPKVPEPAPYEFLADMPPVNTVDLDILRLTALFAARSGPRFAQELARREAQNYQFDFLKPDHSLFRYYNQVVAQYTAVMQAEQSRIDKLTARGGGTDYLTESERRARGRREVMREVQERAQWEKWEREKQKQAEDEAERNRIAFAEIDWQDFVVVGTVEFTEQDDLIELPAPISLSDIVNRSLKQKKMAAMIMEGQEVLEDDDDDAAQLEMQAAAAVTASQPGTLPQDETMMEVDSDEETAPVAAAAKPAAPTGAIKIRTDYVPKSKRDKKAITTTCSICGQQIPEDEMAEHVRIELLDPRWKEKQRQTEANRSASNILPAGADVAASLRDLAKRRTDIFGSHATEEERRAAAAEEARLQRQRESKAWDGHIATAEGITEQYQMGANLNEQIEALHRAKGLSENEAAIAANVGPNIPTDLNANIPSGPAVDAAALASGAAITAAPNPALQQPGRQYGGQPFSYPGMPPAPPGTFPATGANGFVRPADVPPDGEPSAKRMRMPKLPGGHYYPEKEWLAAHSEPITVVVKLPIYNDKPEWGLKGQDLPLRDVDLRTLVSGLRDLIQKETSVPNARQQFSISGRPLQLKNTLASYNFEDGDTVVLTIKDNKKR